jgi:RHS repeat-associated protein
MREVRSPCVFKLPFGEEFVNRTRAQGYTGDSTRQKFAQYERDSETNLDFAQARHYSNPQDRFTRPDPLMASASIAEPQSWNR